MRTEKLMLLIMCMTYGWFSYTENQNIAILLCTVSYMAAICDSEFWEELLAQYDRQKEFIRDVYSFFRKIMLTQYVFFVALQPSDVLVDFYTSICAFAFFYYLKTYLKTRENLIMDYIPEARRQFIWNYCIVLLLFTVVYFTLFIYVFPVEHVEYTGLTIRNAIKKLLFWRW